MSLGLWVGGAWLPHTVRAQDPLDDERPPGMDGNDDVGFGFAEEPERPTDPWRILGSFGVGAALRPVNNVDFFQDRFGPAYVDIYGGVLFPAASDLRHGAGFTLSTNATGDGSDFSGVDPLGQWVLGLGYFGQYRFGDTLMLHGKLSVLLALYNPEVDMQRSFSSSVGGELAVGATVLLTAGFGLYGEIGFSLFSGQDSTAHPLLTGELGIAIDYEVLP